MTIGWFIFMTSVLGYWRVKRWETSIAASNVQPATEDQQHESELLSNLQASLATSTLPNNPPGRTPTSARPLSQQQTAPGNPRSRTREEEEMIRQDERMRRDLSNQGYFI